ncbi:MAG: sugar phosphorylase [Anaerolineae bacterium]|nr:sugar phosphorylase [Anaerolineae bacterium]
MAVIPEDLKHRIMEKLALLYGAEQAAEVWSRLAARLESQEARPAHSAPDARVTEKDVVLITYGDMLHQPGETPLQTLHTMLSTYLKGVINTVHILPFFPYSSDDGFSVIDYLQVDPALGSWEDIHRLNADFRLMFDAVINHISAGSEWFQRFVTGIPAYQDYFIRVDPEADLSRVVRPRTLPLLTPVETASGTQHLWTTFSADQIDLNYANPDVLLAVIDVLLAYVEHGADLIRLDAIAYLWKEIGTTCIHLPQTHAVVQLMRDVLDAVAPDVLIITETNVPHEENISYFGDGTNEAQLVYQFSLPPLILHSFRVGNARELAAWAQSLEKVSDTTTFFNFTASHDGIGVRPATGLISDADIDALTELAERHGGQVSYKVNSDGTQSPYELNVTYVDAILGLGSVEPAAQARRFLASQAIMLAFVGVPGIYFHSLLGSRNWSAGVAETGRARTINREKLDYETVQAELADPTTLRHQVFTRYCDLIRIRISESAFHPNGAQEVLDLNNSLFALRRTSPDGAERIIAVHNVSGKLQTLSLTLDHAGVESLQGMTDLITGEYHAWHPGLTLTLDPYEIMWLKIAR